MMTADMPPAPKRPRKVYRACEVCTIAKARCEEVLPDGCARCRRRGESCNLAGIEDAQGPPGNGHQAPPSANVEHLIQRIDQLEQTLRSVSQTPQLTTPTPPVPLTSSTNSSFMMASPVSQTSSVYTILPRPLDVDSIRKAIRGTPASVRYGEKGFVASDLEGFPSVVARGMMDKVQVDMAFQLFKHRFCTIFPFAPYLLSTTSTPSHPFLILAILAHVPETAPSNLNVLIDESVLHAMTGCISVDVMLALLILALAPVLASSAEHIPPTPMRLIGMAYDIGRNLGLERKARILLDRPASAIKLYAERITEELLLWEAVKQYFVIMSMIWTQRDELPTSHLQSLPFPHTDHFMRTYSFLSLQQRLIDIFIPTTHRVMDMDARAMFETFEIGSLEPEYRIIENEVDVFIGEHPQYKSLGRCLLSALSIRLTCLLYLNPFPSAEKYARSAQTFVANAYLTAGAALVRHFLSLASAPIPGYILHCIVVAMSMHRRTCVVLKKVGVEPSTMVDVESLNTAEYMMSSLEGMGGKMVREMWSSLEEDMDDSSVDQYDWAQLAEFCQGLWS